MIKSYIITNEAKESIRLEMTRPETSGFIIKSVEGLGPTKANINMTDIASHNGSFYKSSRLERRDIIFTLLFQDSLTESIEDVRHKSYKYFPEGERVRITVETDTRIAYTDGIVEHNEPTIYGEERVGCTVTVICPDPYLYSPSIFDNVFSGVKPLFEFPFSNESLTEPLLEMGSIEQNTTKVVYNSGEVEVGLSMIIHALDTASDITIFNLTTEEQMKISTSRITVNGVTGLLAKDTITIESHPMEKSITLLRNGVTYNILNCLDRGTKWFSLSKGDNLFAYKAEEGEANLQFRILHNVAYRGV